MTGDQFAAFVHEDRNRPAEFPHRGGYLVDLFRRNDRRMQAFVGSVPFE